MYPLAGDEEGEEDAGIGDSSSASGVVAAGAGVVGSVATSDEDLGVVAEVVGMVTASTLERLLVRG